MSECGGKRSAAEVQLTTPASSQRLMREALWLGVILGATLILSQIEHLGHLPGPGYWSSSVLLLLSWWYKHRFDVPVRFFPVASRWDAWGGLFAIGLTVVLLASMWLPLRSVVVFHSTLPQRLHLLVLVPLSEELYFRGLLLDHLRKSFSPFNALLLCTLLFALLHWPASGMFVAAVLSLATGCLVLKSGGWMYAFQLHLAWNGFVGAQDAGSLPGRWQWTVAAVIILLVTAATNILLHRGSRK